MADPQDPEGPTPPAKKAPAKKAPAKKAPAKKAPAKKAPAKKAPTTQAQPALTARIEPPALASAPVPAALEPAAPAQRETFGRGHAVPISLALAGTGLAVFVLSRLRHGWRAARDVF